MPVEPLPKPRVTNRFPDASTSLLGSFLEELSIKMYSVEKPVGLTFLIIAISPFTKPDAFSTDIVLCVSVCILFGFIAEAVKTVELAIYN